MRGSVHLISTLELIIIYNYSLMDVLFVKISLDFFFPFYSEHMSINSYSITHFGHSFRI